MVTQVGRYPQKGAEMPEPIEDVNIVDPSTTEQVVNPDETTTQEVITETQAGVTSPPEEVKETGQLTQPDGRPEINYAMEALRKVNELSESFKQFQTSQTQPQQQQYSKAQLRAFVEQTQDPNQKVWALEEIDKLDKVERQAEIRQIFEGQQKKSQEDMQRSQSFQFVAQNFPEIILNDNLGNFVGFNQNNPLYQKIDEYMRNPIIAQNPQGLIAAAKMAAFDLGISMNKKLANKINTTTAQLRKEQKRQLISGGGTTLAGDTGKSHIAKLAEQYRKTGDKEVFKELVKARGLVPQG